MLWRLTKYVSISIHSYTFKRIFWQSISVTDHDSFRELLAYQRPKTKSSDIPHRTKLTESILQRADQIGKELAKKLRDAPGKVCLTYDGWTSAVMTAYLAVTVHYIDSEWKLQAELLTFDELSGSHTGENTGQVLYNILNATGIKDKVSLNLVSFIFYANIYYTS